ncbi:MAG: RluA family pseudouridine synthase [bacterium]
MEILYEDNHCIAVNKPHGLPTQEDESKDESLMDQVKEFIKERDQKPGNVFLGMVHRLDRPVGGVVLFAKTSKGASRLAEQFREHLIEKVYLAMVEGTPEDTEGTVVEWIEKDTKNNIVMGYDHEMPNTQRAETTWRVIKADAANTLIEVRPKTGKPHQIRSAMRRIGTPIVGDLKYGARDRMGNTIGLFAKSLSFNQPVTGKRITVNAKPTHEVFSLSNR